MTNKKIFRVLVLAAFAAMVAIAPLQAAQGCQKQGEHKKMMGQGCQAGQGCQMLKIVPNLSDEQKAKLEKLHLEHQKVLAAAKADMEKLRAEMQGLMKDPVDVKKAEAKIDELAKFHAGMMKKHLAQRLAVLALLSEEQKAKLPAMAGCLMGGMGGAMSGHGRQADGCQAKAQGCCQAKAQDCCQKAEPQAGKGCGHKQGQAKAGCAAKPECQAKIAGDKPEEKK